MSKFFLGFGVLVMMMSCGKDIDQFIPNVNQEVVGDISHLTSKLKQDIAGQVTYTVSVPCFGLKTFEVDKDVVIDIPKDFVDITQYPCTNGFFDVKITVLDSKGEILAAGIPTISENTLLESRVEIKIEIFSGTHPVKLAHEKRIRILVNDPDPRERMELFYGEGDHWLQADGDPTKWSNVSNEEWFFQGDSLQQPITGVGYSTFSDSIDWVNVDVYFQIPAEQRTPVCVQLPEGFTNKNTAVFMVFDDYRSITNLPGDSTRMQFCEHYGSTPLGFKTTFVVISERGEGNYYFAAKSTSITPYLTEELVPLKTPYEEIKHYIMGL